MPAICREPAAKPAHAVCQIYLGAAAQPIAAVATSKSSYACEQKQISRIFKHWTRDRRRHMPENLFGA